jgi:hypothetical protein
VGPPDPDPVPNPPAPVPMAAPSCPNPTPGGNLVGSKVVGSNAVVLVPSPPPNGN